LRRLARKIAKKNLYTLGGISRNGDKEMISQIGSQIGSSQLARFFEFLANVEEDSYYIIHYFVAPEPALVIADIHGQQMLTIVYPEQYVILHMLLTYLFDNGVPTSQGAELILAMQGEQILSLLG